MAKNQTAWGQTRRIEGLASGVKGGALVLYKGYAGVVVKDITGTTEDIVSLHHGAVKGPPGLEKGDGNGDMALTGVYKMVDEDYPGSPLADGDLVERASSSGVKASTASDLDVGHVLGAPYDEVVDVETGSTIRFVDVRLIEQPNGVGNTVIS